MLKMKKMFLVAAVLAMLSGGYPLPVAYASSACNASVSPSTVDPGSEVALQFDIGNTGSENILWVQAQRPTVSYSVNGITQSGWVDATDDNGTTLTASSIPPGDSYSFQLAMFTGPSEEASGPWDRAGICECRRERRSGMQRFARYLNSNTYRTTVSQRRIRYRAHQLYPHYRYSSLDQ